MDLYHVEKFHSKRFVFFLSKCSANCHSQAHERNFQKFHSKVRFTIIDLSMHKLCGLDKLTCIQKWKHINEYKNWQQFSDTACSRPVEEFSAIDKVTSLWLAFFTRRHVGDVMMFKERDIMLRAFSGCGMMHMFNITIFVNFVLVKFSNILRIIVGIILLLEVFTCWNSKLTSVCHAPFIDCWLFITLNPVELPSMLWQLTSFVCLKNIASFTFQASFCWNNECAVCQVKFSSPLVLKRDVVGLNFTESKVGWYFWGHIVVVP